MLRHSILTHMLYKISCSVCRTDIRLDAAAMPRTLMYDVHPLAGCRSGCCLALRSGSLTYNHEASAQDSYGCMIDCRTVLNEKLLCQPERGHSCPCRMREVPKHACLSGCEKVHGGAAAASAMLWPLTTCQPSP